MEVGPSHCSQNHPRRGQKRYFFVGYICKKFKSLESNFTGFVQNPAPAVRDGACGDMDLSLPIFQAFRREFTSAASVALTAEPFTAYARTDISVVFVRALMIF